MHLIIMHRLLISRNLLQRFYAERPDTMARLPRLFRKVFTCDECITASVIVAALQATLTAVYVHAMRYTAHDQLAYS